MGFHVPWEIELREGVLIEPLSRMVQCFLKFSGA